MCRVPLDPLCYVGRHKEILNPTRLSDFDRQLQIASEIARSQESWLGRIEDAVRWCSGALVKMETALLECCNMARSIGEDCPGWQRCWTGRIGRVVQMPFPQAYLRHMLEQKKGLLYEAGQLNAMLGIADESAAGEAGDIESGYDPDGNGDASKRQ